jgi:hypothetical protein
MRKPNFIIMGFPKCGTTSLHHYLEEHPNIFMPSQKELHYFTSKKLAILNNGPGDKIVKQTQIKSLSRYLSFFKNVNDEIAIGEASPSYINYPEFFPEIKKTLDDPKVIIIIRDPINRAYSNYLHLKRESRETLSFKESIFAEEKRKKLEYSDFWYYKFNSTYFDKIKKAKSVFSKVLVLTQEDLNQKPEQTIKVVYSFLGVDKNHKIGNLDKRYNLGGNYSSNIITRILFKPSKTKNILKKFVKPTSRIKVYLTFLSKYFLKPTEEMDLETVDLLRKHFKNDVKKIEKMNVNIKSWREY